jgi:rhodanese-related sulfurtransferase
MLDIFKKLFGQTESVDLQDLIGKGAFLVDVRTPGEFSEGSVKGAINIPLDKIGNQTDKLKGKNHIIVFCRSGNRSAQAKSILESKGFTNVTNGGSWTNVKQYV